jgi:hypothetical protein
VNSWITIDNNLVDYAKQLQRDMEKQKTNSDSTRDLNKDKNLIGAIGQLVATKQIRDWGYDVETCYFDPEVSSDSCDFMWKYEKVDVKSSPGYASGHNSRFLIKEESESKKVDRYVFVKVNLEERNCYIAGCITYNDFWNKALVFESPRIKFPCKYVLGKDLTSFKDFILK